MQLVDIGANLTHESFRNDLDAVLERATGVGVAQFVITGADEAGSTAALNLARQHPDCMRATAGVHPHVSAQASDSMAEHLRALAAHDLVTVIGEAGLDFNRDFSPRPIQEARFEEQLALAAELKMPVFGHERDAHAHFRDIVKAWRDQLPALVVHCFTGDREALHAYLDLDCHIGITGWICDERRGHHLREFVGDIPADRLMIETDAPYLLPRDLKPKPKSRRNEPMHLPHILHTLARVRGEDPDTLAAATTATARQFFGLPSTA